MEQTSVDWLITQILDDQNKKRKSKKEWWEIFEHAKEIEMEGIIKSYENGWKNGTLKKAPSFGIDYYNEIYKPYKP